MTKNLSALTILCEYIFIHEIERGTNDKKINECNFLCHYNHNINNKVQKLRRQDKVLIHFVCLYTYNNTSFQYIYIFNSNCCTRYYIIYENNSYIHYISYKSALMMMIVINLLLSQSACKLKSCSLFSKWNRKIIGLKKYV